MRYWRMEEFELISEIEKHQKELEVSLVNGVADWEMYIKVVNQIRGLEISKTVIRDVYTRFNNGESTDSDESE